MYFPPTRHCVPLSSGHTPYGFACQMLSTKAYASEILTWWVAPWIQICMGCLSERKWACRSFVSEGKKTQNTHLPSKQSLLPWNPAHHVISLAVRNIEQGLKCEQFSSQGLTQACLSVSIYQQSMHCANYRQMDPLSNACRLLWGATAQAAFSKGLLLPAADSKMRDMLKER